MTNWRWAVRLMLASVCAVALCGGLSSQVFAVQKKTKEQIPAIVSAKPSKPSPEPPQKTAIAQVKKPLPPIDQARHQEALQKQAKETITEPKAASRKSRSRVGLNKKVAPKALVQPRTDLMYHGMLEDAQRYDPRPNSRTAGVPNPQTPDLIHDHFQELDRNQDGRIDPVERAFGRLDIDRDLDIRQLQ